VQSGTEADGVYGFGITEVDLDTFSNLLRVETILEGSSVGQTSGGTGFVKAQNATAVNGWEYFGASAVAKVSPTGTECGEFIVASIHDEGDPVNNPATRQVCEADTTCDAGLCEEFTCEDKCGTGWTCSIEFEGQTRARRRRCPACSAPAPPTGFRTWQLGVTGDSLNLGACNLEAAGIVDVPFNQAIFATTHNSYSGNIAGARGSILRQLDSAISSTPIRSIEFDLHDDGFASRQDFQIGHFSVGDEVDHSSPNPNTNELSPWLSQVSDWMTANPSAAPLTVTFDFKDAIDDNRPREGDFDDFNEILRRSFAEKIFRPTDLGDSWPSVQALRGRVMAVVSGGANFLPRYSNSSRLAYLAEHGFDPGIGANSHGRIVATFQYERLPSVIGYWSGQYDASGRVRWTQKEVAGVGTAASVAVSDSGLVAFAWRKPSAIEVTLGRLDDRGLISLLWQGSPVILPNGDTSEPIIEFQGDDRLTLFWGQHVLSGTITTGSVLWAPGTGSPTRTRRDVVTIGDGFVRVFSGARYPSQVLYYGTDRVPEARLTWEQLAFAEYQDPDKNTELRNQWFWAFPAKEFDKVKEGRRMSRVVRGWDFDSSHVAQYSEIAPTFPATNEPYKSWYGAFLTGHCRKLWGVLECEPAR